MGKWIGAGMILLGCTGLLYQWYKTQKERQRLLMEWIRLLSGWEHSLLLEKSRLKEFLCRFDAREEAFRLFLEKLVLAIEERRYPFGQRIWNEVLSSCRKQMPLTKEQWEILHQASDAFFGVNCDEALRNTRRSIQGLKEAQSMEQREFLQKQKVYMPVGMLGGILLIILFL